MRLFIVLFLFAASAWGPANQPLRLEKTIELPNVEGRIDHLSVDVAGGRLFVSALGNNTVEVTDIKAGTRVKTISGLQEPQGVLYVPSTDRLYVANSKDGSVRIFDGNSYAALKTLECGDDAAIFATTPTTSESMWATSILCAAVRGRSGPANSNHAKYEGRS
jgi:DNA-binding beta-propeller fold protein YncE